MTAPNQNVTLWRGDSMTITIQVLDGDGEFVNLDGATARWWMGKNVNARGSDIYIQKTSDIDGGLVVTQVTSDEWNLVITLSPSDTESLTASNNYYHEAEVVDFMGNISTVTTGKFILKPTLIPDVL